MLNKVKQYLLRYVLDAYSMKIGALIVAVIFLVSSAGLLWFYSVTATRISRMAFDVKQQELDQVVTFVDAQIRQFQGMVISLSIDDEVNNLNAIHHMEDKDRIRRVLGMENRLISLKNTNPLLHSVYLFYPNTECVIFDALYKAEDVEDLQYIPQGLGPDSPLQMTRSIGSRFSRFTDTGGKDFLKLAQCLRYGAGSGYVVLNVETAQLEALVYSLLSKSTSGVVAMDEEGSVMFQAGLSEALSKAVSAQESSEFEVAGIRYIALRGASATTGWHYFLVVPHREMHAEDTQLGYFIGFVIAGIIVAGSILGILAANRITRPVNQLYEAVFSSRERDPKKDRFDYITRAFEDLRSLNSAMMEERMILEALLHSDAASPDSTVRRELHGTGKTAQPEPTNGDARLSAMLPHPAYLVAAIHFHTSQEKPGGIGSVKINVCARYVEQALERAGICQCVQFEPDKLAVIVNHPMDVGRDELLPMLSALVDKLNALSGTDVNIGIGEDATSTTSISKSFSEALTALTYMFVTGRNEIIHYSSTLHASVQAFHYPFDLEKQLLDALRQCDSIQTQRILKEWFALFDEEDSATPLMSRQVLLYLMGTIRQLAGKLLPEQAWGPYFNEENDCRMTEGKSLNELRQHVASLCMGLLSTLKAYRSQRNAELADQILAHIRENASGELTVEQIAAAFHISVSYCYRVLREERRLSPVNYLSGVRVGRAADMLKETDKTVACISGACGFENLQAFYRQFRKIMGVSPTEFRKMETLLP